MSKYLSKQFFSFALLVPLLSYSGATYAESQEKALEQQQELQDTNNLRLVQLQPEVITSLQEAAKSQHPAIKELLGYTEDALAPYETALAAVEAALEFHIKNNALSHATVMRDYKQALITGTAVIPQDQENTPLTRGLLRERCFPNIRTRSLRTNRVCTNELGANNATINNLTVTGNQTIDGNLTVKGTINNAVVSSPLTLSGLCTDGVLNLPCDLNVGGDETITGDLTVTGSIIGAIDPASLCSNGSLALPCSLNVTGDINNTGNTTIGGILTVNSATTFNGNLTVTGTITGALNPANLCSNGAVTIPCNLQFNSNSNTLNALGDSAEPALNLIRGTIAPNLTATVSTLPLQVTIANNPTILVGAGFTVSATPSITIPIIITTGALVGTINVTFDSGVHFTSRPSITLGTEDTQTAGITQLYDYRVTNVSTTGFSLEITSALGIPLLPGLTLTAGNINFMAIGPTTSA